MLMLPLGNAIGACRSLKAALGEGRRNVLLVIWLAALLRQCFSGLHREAFYDVHTAPRGSSSRGNYKRASGQTITEPRRPYICNRMHFERDQQFHALMEQLLTMRKGEAAVGCAAGSRRRIPRCGARRPVP